MQPFQLIPLLLASLRVGTASAFQQNPSSFFCRRVGLAQSSAPFGTAGAGPGPLFSTADAIEDVGYTVSVQKPLGVIFGENSDPYYGLVVDDVIEAQNGAVAGIRVGDQLVSVNGQMVVGKDFDTVMGMLQNSPARMDLKMYRGTVSALFTIINNRIGEGAFVSGGQDDDQDEGEEPVIMDENYESPVKIEVKERKPLGIGDVFKAMKKVTENTLASDDGETSKQEKKKGGGLFGFGGEAIQLDGDDASTLK